MKSGNAKVPLSPYQTLHDGAEYSMLLFSSDYYFLNVNCRGGKNLTESPPYTKPQTMTH